MSGYCLMSCQTIMCWTAMRTDVMSLTKGEAKQFLQGLTQEK